ncbi:MAG: DUF2887 domain-containing protein [Planctomycetaceae bacterium]|nr:MAG: DUF2887 domain-containing protein [Planctomycetaceae bacterium]
MPKWIFELASLPSRGKSGLKSLTVKELERRADGVVIPESLDQPLTVVEFPFQKVPTLFCRPKDQDASSNASSSRSQRGRHGSILAHPTVRCADGRRWGMRRFRGRKKSSQREG